MCEYDLFNGSYDRKWEKKLTENFKEVNYWKSCLQETIAFVRFVHYWRLIFFSADVVLFICVPLRKLIS
jgi:hypothetical protein